MSEKIINPILPGFNPDPSIVRVEDDYYIATSTFEWYPGVQIHHSKDLRNWRLVSRPLNRPDLLDMRGNPDSCGIWAPCLSWSDGLFHLIYTDVKRHSGQYKDSHNYLTTCEKIDGEWSARIHMNSSGFDPSLFHDDDGRKWFVNMIWDGRYKKNPFGGVYLQEYCPREEKLIGEVINIFRGTDLALTEAPHLYKRGDFYYLVTAEGGTGYTHAMTLARSKDIRGPYITDPQGYLLTTRNHRDLPLQRCGHGDLVDTPDGEHYLVHLCSRPIEGLRRSPLGRETGLQKTRWSDDGWLRIEGATGDGLPELEVEAPAIPTQPFEPAVTRHEFDSGVLPPEFQWLRTPYPESFMSLTENPGYLRLKGKESIGSWFDQALIARRQEALSFTAETCMEFTPETFQQSAGLVCYYNAQKFHYLQVSVDEAGARFIDVASCEGNPEFRLEFPLREGLIRGETHDQRFMLPADGPIWLRASVDHHRLNFSWSIDGQQWTAIPLTLDHSIISDEAGRGEGNSFTGAFVGMCCQDLAGTSLPADFSHFYYDEK